MKKIISTILVVVIISLSVITSTAYTKPEEFIYGDVDMDGVVTVKDATAIQKGLAGLEYLTAVQRYLADPNGEGVTVKSATAIQKQVAGIEGDNSKVGEAVFIEEPSVFKKADQELPVTGDEVIFAQTEYVDFNINSEASNYFNSNMFYVFVESHYILKDLENAELANKYNDEYFEKNALIVMSLKGSSSKKYRVDSIMKSEGVLGIDYTLLFPEGGVITTDVVNSRVYIEVCKSDIAAITGIVTYQNTATY